MNEGLIILLVVCAAIIAYLGVRAINRQRPLTIQQAWIYYLRNKDQLPAEQRAVVDFVQHKLAPSTVESLRNKLLKVEADSLKAKEPLVPLRAAIMDAVDMGLLYEAILGEDDQVKKAAQAELGSEFTQDKLDWGYITGTFASHLLRVYSGLKYDDVAADDWFSYYVAEARARTQALISFLKERATGGTGTVGAMLWKAWPEAMAQLRVGREKLLSFPRKTPIRTDRSWDLHKEVQTLIERNEELTKLYKSFGYSPEADRRLTELSRELKGLIRVTISDQAVFQRALAEVQQHIEQHKRGELPYDPLVMSDPSLFNAVIAARDDPAKVLELLQADPLEKRLPNHIEWEAIRRVPQDVPRFVKSLDEVEIWVKAYQGFPPAEVREEILKMVADVRRNLEAGRSVAVHLNGLCSKVERAYRYLDYIVSTPVDMPSRYVGEGFWEIDNSEAKTRREQLDDLLRDLVSELR